MTVGDGKMKLAEKTIDSITRLKLKSGRSVEIHIIKQDNDIDRLIIEKDNERLSLEYGEISDFITLFKDFLHDV